MTDPFAVLGIAPSATEGEIREAYLRRSKQLHPDRFADAPEAEQAAATRAMQELNAAYDAARHRDTSTPPLPPPTAPNHTAATPYRSSYVPTPPRRGLRWPVVIVAALLLTSFLVALTGDSTKHGRPPTGADFAQLEGECVTFDNVGQPDEVVDCTRQHDGRVMRVVDHGTPCPVWTNETVAGATKDLCLDTHQ